MARNRRGTRVIQDVRPALRSATRHHIAAVWVEETKKLGIQVDPGEVMAIFNEPAHPPVPLSRISVLDLEASGLGSTSFPTEIGWALLHEDGSIASGSCLIRTAAKWLRYNNAWSDAAERLSGISMQMLDRDGASPREALARFLTAVGDRDLYSDEPDYDAHWLKMLADAAGISFDVSKINDFKELIEEMGMIVELDQPPRHRAEADARRLATGLLKR